MVREALISSIDYYLDNPSVLGVIASLLIIGFLINLAFKKQYDESGKDHR